MTDAKTSLPNRAGPTRDEALAVILEALERLRFGTIHVTIHEGKLVQVDITDRKRFQA